MNRVRAVAAVVLLVLTVGAGRPARAADPSPGGVVEDVAPGIDYRAFSFATGHGATRVHVLSVDLDDPRVRVGLLYPGAVADRAPVSSMAERQGAVAAVNGDFFDITEEQHPGIPATGAAVGAAVLDGRPLKAAVPEGQRFGGVLPSGATGQEVIGVGVDGRARTARLTLDGVLRTPSGPVPLGGLNQYALPEGSIGVFTPQWGSTPRARAACGRDHDRAAPCTHDTFELTVSHGRVDATAEAPGEGPIASGSEVLLGREAGAGALKALAPGTPVTVEYRLASTSRVPFAFALGAYPLLRGGRLLPDLDAATVQPRTAAGIADGGRRLYLVVTDGREGTSTGLTLAELADLLGSLACEEAVYLDGGASSTLVTRDHATGRVDVRNSLDHGQERRVPNGIALYSR
ncbi:phosphodiester glycosidase family protein [Kitasatospora sp. NPDC101176]|uniref:phosphodiester glycosidase family protein n=1 Tax=Kitasatospora sp. NPDC101176 TaxID=3364099 RepID=UPI003809986C